MSSQKLKFKWTEDLERVLIDLWATKLVDLRKQKRNSHVYSDMAQYINCEYKEILNSRTITAAEIKIKINNLTQRYRAEKKAIGPSGGAPSSWKYFESINKIVGSLPCNDLSLIEESMSSPQGLELSNYYSEEQFEIINEDVESESEATSDAPGSVPLASDTSMPSTSSMTSSSSVKRKLLKRKATTRLDEQLLQEIKRANDLTETEINESKELHAMQMQTLNVLQKTCNALLTSLQDSENKDK